MKDKLDPKRVKHIISAEDIRQRLEQRAGFLLDLIKHIGTGGRPLNKDEKLAVRESYIAVIAEYTDELRHFFITGNTKQCQQCLEMVYDTMAAIDKL